MNHFLINSAIFLCACFIIISCEKNKDEKENSNSDILEKLTVSGSVRNIENGKDGYTALIQTTAGDSYQALVSIVNLGGPEHFSRFEIGDKVKVRGMILDMNGEQYIRVEKILSAETTRTMLSISGDGFRGIKVGDKIADHADYISEKQMNGPEGYFKVFTIKDFNNNPAGYLMPNPNDKTVVGSITVTTLMAETGEGIKVGSTFGELRAKLPNLEVHGSEIEGRTYAKFADLSYRLDSPNFSFDVDVEKISAQAKITEIIVNGGGG